MQGDVLPLPHSQCHYHAAIVSARTIAIAMPATLPQLGANGFVDFFFGTAGMLAKGLVGSEFERVCVCVCGLGCTATVTASFVTSCANGLVGPGLAVDGFGETGADMLVCFVANEFV